VAPKQADKVNLDNVQDLMAKFRNHQKSQYIPEKIVINRSSSKKRMERDDQDIQNILELL
jgi:hypothetical protein